MACPSRHRRGPPRRVRARARRPVRRRAPGTSTTCCSRTAASSSAATRCWSPASRSARSTTSRLTDDAQADVTISVDEPLREGTTAIIRATSLSGIANRYVSITPGPNNAPELARRRHPRRRQDDLARRPRPALRHLQPPHPRRASQLHPGQRRDLRRQHRRRAQHLQVLRPGAGCDPAPVRRADAATSHALSQFLVQGSTGARSDRPAPQRSLGADREREPGARRDREPEPRARPLPGGLPADASPGEHHLRQPARRPRRPDPARQRLQACDQGPGPVPAQAAPGRASARSPSSTRCDWRSPARGSTTI